MQVGITVFSTGSARSSSLMGKAEVEPSTIISAGLASVLGN